MNYRRMLLALFVLAAAVVGNAGYTTIRADRSVDVAVANDENAYLAFSDAGADDAIQNGTTGTARTIDNQLGQEIRLRGTEEDSDAGVSFVGLNASSGTSEEVSVGAGETAEVIVECTDSDDGDVTIAFTAEGDGILVETTRTIDVNCEPASTPTPAP